MSDDERKKLEKEVAGIRARLKWTHLSVEALDAYRERLDYLEAVLREDKNG